MGALAIRGDFRDFIFNLALPRRLVEWASTVLSNFKKEKPEEIHYSGKEQNKSFQRCARNISPDLRTPLMDVTS